MPLNGHAVEARLYAEDPERGFLPSTGTLVALQFPGRGIRVDTGVEAGGEVTPYYDPMIAKVIAHAPTARAALDRLATALERTVVAGPRTNVAFLAALAAPPEFRAGTFDTGFIDAIWRRSALSSPIALRPRVRRGALLARDAARIGRASTARPTRRLRHGMQPTDSSSAGRARSRSDSGRWRAGEATSLRRGRPAVAVDGVPAALMPSRSKPADAVYVLRKGRQTVVGAADLGAGDLDHGDGDGVDQGADARQGAGAAGGHGDSVEKGQRWP